VFCWSPSWLAKMAMDRFYCMFKFESAAPGDFKCLLEGRGMAAVISAGGGEKDGADAVEDTCRRMAEFGRARRFSALIAANVQSPQAIRADANLVERARAFGSSLVS
jgi:hypothetical protein